jgi:outer membrane lipoprotein carrier protein
MRWDYVTPTGKLFLSDGKDVYLYTPDSKRVEKMPLKESEDWRAPLAFLLGKLDFQREFRDIAIKPAGSTYIITAKAKSDKLPYEDVRITTTPNYTITNLVVTGQDQSVLTFDFANEKLNPVVNDAIFKFQMPAGATLVTPEAGQ